MINGLPAVHCGRPGRFGNAFRVGVDGTAEECVAKFRKALEAALAKSLAARPPFLRIARDLHTLRGKNLACWCKRGAPCHVDVYLDLANR